MSASATSIALPVVTGPADTFRCEKYACVLTARACAIRQGTTYTQRIGGNADVRREQRVALEFKFCASGECAQGAAVAKALRGQHVEPPRPQNVWAQLRARREQANPARLILAPRATPVLAPPPPARTQRSTTPPAAPASEPAKEKPMPAVKSVPCAWTEEDCKNLVSPSSRSGCCTKHSAALRYRQKHGGSVAARAKPPPPAPDDIVAILQQQLDGCARCSSIRRALEALRA